MRLEDGRHQGFLQLTRQFISHEKEIIFPETARELGMHSLRFRDVMEACKAPGAPYMLWLVGHSQGAAVAQLEMLYLLEEGVLPEYITGYGFASPSVLAGNAAPGDSPMFHILNSDDLVPHMGAVWHAGKLLVYRASPEMRRACYRWRWDAQSVADRKLARNVTGQMTDTAHDIMVGMAYLRLLEEEPLGMIEEGLRSLGHALPYMPGMVAGRVDATMQKAIERVLDIAGEAYEQHVGRPVDLQGVIHIMQTIRSITEQIGMERFARAFGELCIEPHRAQNLEDGMDTAYQYVARMCYRQLLPARDGEWVSDCGQ